MSVSHELRTPLTAIRGHVAALREGVVTDPELAETSLQIVADEAERLGRLVNDVLDLAKLDAHRFTVLTEEVDMARLLERAYSTFADEARRREIEYTQETDGAPVIVSDGDRVLQIISNLLSNAFRWTPDGGRIDLALESTNGTLAVDVADTGPGIAPDERERIFRPFWSTDGRGTGLGLPIARELAVALGGRIELNSQVGEGSRFRLVLPLRARPRRFRGASRLAPRRWRARRAQAARPRPASRRRRGRRAARDRRCGHAARRADRPRAARAGGSPG